MKWISFLSELNLPIPGHFIPLIPQVSMFSPAISCLTTSNLIWLMDLTFHAFLCIIVPYNIGFDFHHQSHLQLGIFFHFGSISSFFLELFLHSSPVAHWAPTNLGNSSFSVLSFCLSYCFIVLLPEQVCRTLLLTGAGQGLSLSCFFLHSDSLLNFGMLDF